MTTVVTENCLGCRFTECTTVCPVSCFHRDDEMLYIDPDVCVDCGACGPACPVSAIYDVNDLPTELARWIQINADRAPTLPVVTSKIDPLPGAATKKEALGF